MDCVQYPVLISNGTENFSCDDHNMTMAKKIGDHGGKILICGKLFQKFNCLNFVRRHLLFAIGFSRYIFYFYFVFRFYPDSFIVNQNVDAVSTETANSSMSAKAASNTSKKIYKRGNIILLVILLLRI